MRQFVRQRNDSDAVLLKEQLIVDEVKQEKLEMRNTFIDENPLDKVGICSKLFFSWVSPVLKYTKKHQLSVEELGRVRPEDSTIEQKQRLEQRWTHYRTRSTKDNKLYWAVLSAYSWEFTVSIFWNIVIGALQLTQPFLLRRLIVFIQDQDDDTLFGVFLVLSMGFVQATCYLISEHVNFYTRMTGSKATNALSALIFNKSLKVSPCTNKQFNIGQIVNFVQVDALKMQFLTGQAPMMLRLPFVIIVCFIVLFAYLGWSFLSGIAIFVITFFTNLTLSRIQARLQRAFMHKQDGRVKSIAETLNNIKMLKMYSWIDVFKNNISQKRQEELEYLWKRFRIGQLLVTNLYFFPQLLTAVVFSFYIGFGNTLRLDIAFTVLTILNLIKDPMRSLPHFMGQLIEFRVSMRRIQDYLLVEEINETMVATVPHEETNDAILIRENSAFHYGASVKEGDSGNLVARRGSIALRHSMVSPQGRSNQLQRTESFSSLYQPLALRGREADKTYLPLKDFLILKQIGLSVKQGEFVMIIGDVGSGKTSLLNSITNDMMHAEGTFYQQYCHETIDEIADDLLENARKEMPAYRAPVVLSETISLVQQSPWIQSMTIRDNILFGAPFDREKYDEVIKICQLRRDFEIFPSGDQTEIGEKGINLSGGQKARISLARAVYADKQTILMDDPLSALDANVKKRIFKLVMMRRLRQKTRVLVTHAVDFLHLADTIVCMKEGKIVFQGHFNEVKGHPYLKELVKIHTGHKQERDDFFADNKPQIINTVNDDEDDEDDGIRKVNIDEVPSDSDGERSDGDDNAEHSKFIEEENDVGYVKKRTYSEDLGNLSEDTKKLKGRITTNENEEESRVTAQVYKRYLGYAGGFTQFILTNLTMSVFIVLKVSGDYIVGDWAISSDQHTRFGYYCGIFFFIVFWQSTMVFLRVLCLTYYSFHGTKQLHQDMVEQVMRAPVNLYFDKTPIGRLLNRFSKDLSVIETIVVYEIGTAYVNVYNLFSIFLIAAIVVPWILLIFPVIIFSVIWLYRQSIAATKEMARIESVTRSPILSYLSEAINGNSTIRAFNKENQFKKNNYDLLNKNILATQWQNAVPLWFAIRIDLLSVAIMMSIAFFCVMFRDRSSPVMLALLLTYSISLQSSVITTIRMLMQIETRMVSADRCFNLLKVPQENIHGFKTLTNFRRENPDWPQQGQIEFRDVSLKYRPDTEVVLDQLSFRIGAGEKIGVVGRTGAGKSTICLALSRIVEIVAGQIIIDDVDIKEVQLEYLRKMITVIPQDPSLFNGSLRFNLDPLQQTSDERMLEVLRKAELDYRFTQDAGCLDMVIESNGANLSSGEKSLLCICRAILRHSKVILLDEATANIDVVTEQKIQKLIEEEFAECTMITIAHRLNTIMQSDKVMVLSYGKIIEFDEPQVLAERQDSHFAGLLKEIEQEESNQLPFNGL